MEELKVIMEAISQLGAAGKEAFVWWLVIKYGVSSVLLFSGGCVAGYVVYRIAKFMHEADIDCQTIRRLAKVAGVPDDYGRISRNDLYEAVRAKFVK